MQYTVPHGCSRWVCCAAHSGFFGRATSKEREQVLAHSDLFVGTAWYPEVEPHHWCKAVGIRREDSPGYIDAIAANLAGKNPSAFTLAAIEKSRNKIAGYVFCCVPDNDSPETLSVGHLKVDSEYQRRGVGTMLLAAAEIHAMPQSQAFSAGRESTCPKLLREIRVPTSIELFCRACRRHRT